MQKILLTMGLLAMTTAFTVQAANEKDIGGLDFRVKSLEDRVKSLEEQVKSLTIKKEGGPLNQPNMSNDEVEKWAADSVTRIYSYDFANVDRTLSHLRHLFTAKGYESFLKALKDSGVLKFVQDKKLIVDAQMNGKPKMESQGLDGNLYAWRVAVPITVVYQNSLEKFSQDILVDIEIVRVTTDEAENGIAIHYVTAQAASGSDQGKPQAAPTAKEAVKEAPKADEKKPAGK